MVTTACTTCSSPSPLVIEDFLEIIMQQVLGYLGDRHTHTTGTWVKLYSKYLGDRYTLNGWEIIMHQKTKMKI